MQKISQKILSSHSAIRFFYSQYTTSDSAPVSLVPAVLFALHLYWPASLLLTELNDSAADPSPVL